MSYKIIKILASLIIFSIVAFLGYIAGGTIKYNLDIRKVDKSVERFQESLEEPYKQDTYGGKTPEETWAMYLDALREGDIDLASRYASVEKQKEIKNMIEESVKLNRLEFAIKEFSGELKKEKDYLQGDKAYYYIPIKNSAGEVESYSIIFYLNPHTKVWKIISL